jgi:exopolyphosphatase
MFKSYLKQSKTLIHSLSTQKDKLQPVNLRFIFGNETADMDSIFSSLIYGYYRTLTSTNNEGDLHYIPIVNTRAAEINARFETMYLLNNLKYDPADIIFFDEYNITELVKTYNAEVILVDHNIPSARQQDLIENITEILDHHDDKTSIYKEGQLKRKRIEKIGSTNTLLFDEIWNNGPEDLKSKLEPSVYWIMLATILTDTFNLNPKEKGFRWVDKDEWAKDTLCKLLKGSTEFPQWLDKEGNVDTTLVFESLGSLKFDANMNLNLGMENLFVKDYKAFTYPKGKVGYSVFFFSIDDCLGRYSLEELAKKMREFKSQEELTFLLTLFVHPKEGRSQSDLHREMIILWENKEELEKLTHYLLEQKLELKEQPIELDHTCFRRILDVNSVYTRKVVEPLIAKFMSA